MGLKELGNYTRIKEGKAIITEECSSNRVEEYSRAMCGHVIDVMIQGRSYPSVCELLNISYTTFVAWRQRYPEFNDAVEKGDMLAQKWWEEKGRTWLVTTKRDHKFNTALWIFYMKNKFGWADKTEIDHKQSQEVKITIDLSHVSDNILDKLPDMSTKDMKKMIKVRTADYKIE